MENKSLQRFVTRAKDFPRPRGNFQKLYRCINPAHLISPQEE